MNPKPGRPATSFLDKRQQNAKRAQIRRAIAFQERVLGKQLQPFTDPRAPITSGVLSEVARIAVHSQLPRDDSLDAALVRQSVTTVHLDLSGVDFGGLHVKLGGSKHGVGRFY